jgi:hypothetical protein
MLLSGQVMPVQASQTPSSNPIPVLAYYYIWFDPGSWDRAKIDYPVLGRYSSDDRAVMVQHIRWAKAAGINGFLVSWKSTDVLNRRLDQLVDVAEAEHFKLGIIYQGLDFQRDPLPSDRIANDMDFFIKRYAGREPFKLFNKPLMIWSGTWKFTPEQVAQVTQGRRDALMILASERNLAGYQRVADFVDGNAYYWSSVNPDTNTGYEQKLTGMGEAVHAHGGLWIAPAAPGFDARLIGGTTVVDRKNGDTLRSQINTALQSSPDALGIISWNEFSENSYIEPSKTFGSKYLMDLASILNVPAPKIADFDSSEPTSVFLELFPGSRVAALAGLAAVIVVGLVVIGRRRNR